MINRTKDFWLVAYFLSKYGEVTSNLRTVPPVELETLKWNEAYRMFYELLGKGRAIGAFEHSLKNARDAFDSHIMNSSRIGWRDEERNPSNLNKISKGILDEYSLKDRKKIWFEVSKFTSDKISKRIEDDLISIEQSESDETVITKTEGGKKVFISFRYERDPKLRTLAFKHHGFDCAVCGFNFLKFYGELGEGYGEVHHVEPLSNSKEKQRKTNPKTDLIVVCANCHRMIHRKKDITISVSDLKKRITKNKLIL